MNHPHFTGQVADGKPLSDAAAAWPLSATDVVYDAPYLSLTVDTIESPDGGRHDRAVVRPNGAVGVLALDDQDRVLLVQQYRHAVGQRLLELPAGTLDVVGEPPLDAAKRELAEEADVTAASWAPLLELAVTPGYSSERWEVFVARDLSAVPVEDRTEREAEEADMQHWWLPFDEAVDAVLAGRITDAMTVAGVLAHRVRRVGDSR